MFHIFHYFYHFVIDFASYNG